MLTKQFAKFSFMNAGFSQFSESDGEGGKLTKIGTAENSADGIRTSV